MPRFQFCPQCAAALSDTIDHEGRARRRCGECGFTHYDNPTPVVAAIVEHEDCVVLVQSKGWPSSWFGLVTGFLEREEEAGDAACREVGEELGLDARIESFVGIYSFFRMNQIIMAWHLTATGDITLGDELAAYKRVPTHKLRPWPMGTGKAVRDWLARRGSGRPVDQ
jgi:NADH pyrophosphatase NudC (nudix superfamily)